MKQTIFFVAGKSGGHIIPALTMAQQYHTQGTTCGIFSTATQLDHALITPSKAITHHTELTLSYSLKHPFLYFQLLRAFFKSLRTLHTQRPERVISTGGLVSVPVCLAARLLRIPYELHEFNVEPGAAIKFLASGASHVHLSFPETQNYLRGHCVQTPYPVRFAQHDRTSLETARQQLQIPLQAKVLMIIGGSQGSRWLNEQVKNYLLSLSPAEHEKLFIIHQAGPHDVVQLQEFYAAQRISSSVFAYHDDMAVYYQAADYVITRAGAGVLHELLFFKKPALIIPLEIASTAHQVKNAQAFVAQYPELYTMQRHESLDLKSVLSF